ncbi:MAG: CHAP domain-containing protein, partial [Actinomadura sp.]
QALTRITGGVAVGAALVASIAATSTITDNSAPRSGASLAVAAADQQRPGGVLALDPQTAGHAGRAGRVEAPLSKPRRAPVKPQRVVKAADVIGLAEKQVGIAENNGRGGGTKFQDWYAKSDFGKHTAARDGATPGVYKDAAWCAMFITWLGDNFSFNDQMGGDAYTVTMAKWFEQHGRWGHKPKPGAVVFFDWNGGKTISGIDHVGLVKSLNPDGTINTIEGNISDAVVKKTRTLDKIAGFGYPDYTK